MKRSILWPAIFTHMVVIGVPAIIYYYLRLFGMDLFWLHAGVATFYLVTALVSSWEALTALFRRFAGEVESPTGLLDRAERRAKKLLRVSEGRHPRPLIEVPRSTFLIAAYLPNEQDLIIETLQAVLSVNRPKDGLEVILAYNTPVDLPIEAELRRMEAIYPEIRVLRVEGSESKAENLNTAIDLATGEIVGILDADHHPPADCFERAWRWLESDYEVVQGRNVIRNHDDSFLTRLIGVEFECMYGVTHPARSLGVDTAVFGGSNGYWRRDALKRVRFDPSMMTEDIDATSRALLEGFHICADRSIVSTELAPGNFRSLWFQRKRWAQGWLEVSLAHQRKLWATKNLNFRQKSYWTYLLFFMQAYPVVALQILPIILSLFLFQGSVPLIAHWYFWSTAVITLASGPLGAFVASKNSFQKLTALDVLAYSVTVFFYALLKNMISVVAIYDNMMGRSDWVVTRRQMSLQVRAGGSIS